MIVTPGSSCRVASNWGMKPQVARQPVVIDGYIHLGLGVGLGFDFATDVVEEHLVGGWVPVSR